MTPRNRLATGLLTAALLGAACSSSDDAATTPDETTSTEATSDDTSSETTTEAQSGDVAADIKDFMYDPKDLTVTVGTTVTWTNQDRFGHTVTAGGPNAETGEFDLVMGLTTDSDTTGLMESYTFDEAGTFDYYCRYHPSMVGTVTVTG